MKRNRIFKMVIQAPKVRKPSVRPSRCIIGKECYVRNPKHRLIEKQEWLE